MEDPNYEALEGAEEGLIKRDGEYVNIPVSTTDDLDHVFWKGKDGRLTRIQDMADSHLRNTALMLMGLGYQKYHVPTSMKILWLTAFRIEWERRMLERKVNFNGKKEEIL